MGDYHPDPNSGASGTEWQTVEALRKKGLQVDTVWADQLTHYIRHGNLHYLLELPIAYRHVLVKKYVSVKYDIVHVNQPHGYLAARVLKNRYKHSIFVHRSHGFEGRVTHELRKWTHESFPDNRPKWKKFFGIALSKLLNIHIQLIMRYADGHIVSASECKNFMHSQYGVPLERIAVIPQAPPQEFQTQPAPPMNLSRLHKLLYVGQYAFVKAPMILARTVERLLGAVPDATFTWVCDQRHHNEAKALFSNQSILHRVTFEGWHDQNRLRSIYDQHGIFLFPSFFEGFGKAFIEAMSRGLVVVAARNSGMKDVITDEKNGILVETGDDKAMAEACLHLIGNPKLAFDMANNARDHALNYTWDRVADETLEFYERLLSTVDRHPSSRRL